MEAALGLPRRLSRRGGGGGRLRAPARRLVLAASRCFASSFALGCRRIATATEMSELHRRVAGARAAGGQGPAAVDHWLAAGDFESAADAIAGYGIGLAGTEPETVGRWLDRLPPELCERPVLRLLAGRLAMGAGDFEAAVRECRAGVEGLERDDAPEAILWAARYALTDAYVAALDVEGAADAGAGAEEAGPDAGPGAAFCALYHAAVLARLGRLEESDRVLGRALERPGGRELLAPGCPPFRPCTTSFPPAGSTTPSRTWTSGLRRSRRETPPAAVPICWRSRWRSTRPAVSPRRRWKPSIPCSWPRVKAVSPATSAPGRGLRPRPSWPSWIGPRRRGRSSIAWTASGRDGRAATSTSRGRCSPRAAATGPTPSARDCARSMRRRRMLAFDRVRPGSVLAPLLCDAGRADAAREGLESILEALRRPRVDRANPRRARLRPAPVRRRRCGQPGARGCVRGGGGGRPLSASNRMAAGRGRAVGGSRVRRPRPRSRRIRARCRLPWRTTGRGPHRASPSRGRGGRARGGGGRRAGPRRSRASRTTRAARVVRRPPPLEFRLARRLRDPARRVRGRARALGAQGRRARGPLPSHPRRRAGPRGRAARGLLARQGAGFGATWTADRDIERALGGRPAVGGEPPAGPGALLRPGAPRRRPLRRRRLRRRGGSRARGPGPRARRGLEAAARLWTGEPLPEERYADWSATWRERLNSLHADVLGALAEEHGRAGDHNAAARAARALVDIDPLDEQAQRLLIAHTQTRGAAATRSASFSSAGARWSRSSGSSPRRRRSRFSAASWPAPDPA